MQQPKKVSFIGWIVLIIVALVVIGWISSLFQSDSSSSTSAIQATPTKSISELTGTDWLALPRGRQDTIAQQALRIARCPSRVTANDLALGVTQASQTTAGQSQRVIDMLTTLFLLNGCTVSG